MDTYMQRECWGIIGTKPLSAITSDDRDWGKGKDGRDLLILFKNPKRLKTFLF